MKKVLSFILAFIFAFGMLLPAGAASDADTMLQFNDDGKFRIMQISDIQDGTVLTPATKQFIKEVVIEKKPDLLVLTGDNISAGSATMLIPAIDKLLVKNAINNFMSVFEEIGVPVAVVFGNHDAEEYITREEQMAMYMKYDCCLAIDDGDDIYGCSTYNLPVYSSKDANKIAYNLWMIDSNMYDDVNGGYDYVHQDQLDWYVKTSNELKAQNGGKSVPSMMFQHIIVKEIYDVIIEIPANEKDNYEYVETEEKGVKKYYAIKPEVLRTGELNEMPCPPTINAGQFETVLNQGDVVAMFFGHDHKNTFEVEYKGIDLVNTPTAGFGSYGDEDRGVRIIDIKEGTTEYETSIVEYLDFYAGNDLMLEQYVLYANETDSAEKFVAFFKTIWLSIMSVLSF